MSDEDLPPTEAELREAEQLRRALEPRRDGTIEAPPIDDALSAALLLRSVQRGELSELRMRAVRMRAIKPGKARRRTWLFAIAASVALIVEVLSLVRRPVALPAPSAELLRAQLAAARPNGDLALLDAQLAAHRAKLFAALPGDRGRRP